VRTKLKDIQSGKIFDETFNAGRKLEFIRVEAKTMQFLYDDGDSFVFMDNETYDQLNIPIESIGNGRNFMTGGMNVDLLFDGTEVLDVRLPSHVVLEVIQTDPGFKGNTAQGATKPATVETNYTLNVPLFIDEGDKLKIDTRNGEYVERSKD
jgi:elongation factor P